MVSVAEFAADASVGRAHQVLADRSFFPLNEGAWAELGSVLARHATRKPRLERLLRERSIFEGSGTDGG